MNKVKKTLIALFSSLFFVCTLLFVAACNNGKTLYKIAVDCDTAKGSITLTDSEDPEGYAQGEEVTATVKANEGYEIGAVTVNEASVELTGGVPIRSKWRGIRPSRRPSRRRKIRATAAMMAAMMTRP